MLKQAGLLAVGVIVGLILGWFLAQNRYVIEPEARRSIHVVKELVNHREYDVEGAFSDTELVVYLEGDDGATGQVLCQFHAGDFKVGVEQVRIGPVSKKLGFGRLGYLCEVVTP